MAFGVKQKTPATVDEAVRVTLELESYLPTKGSALSEFEIAQMDEADVAAAVPRTSDRHSNQQQDPVQQIL